MSAVDQRRVFYNERRGLVALKQKDFARAKGYFMEALALASRLGFRGPSVADAYLGIGLCLVQEGDPDYAMQFFNKGLETGPTPGTRLLIDAQINALSAKK